MFRIKFSPNPNFIQKLFVFFVLIYIRTFQFVATAAIQISYFIVLVIWTEQNSQIHTALYSGALYLEYKTSILLNGCLIRVPS
ncbi:hypothetical protein D3C80_1998380 [compost metagenome]